MKVSFSQVQSKFAEMLQKRQLCQKQHSIPGGPEVELRRVIYIRLDEKTPRCLPDLYNLNLTFYFLKLPWLQAGVIVGAGNRREGEGGFAPEALTLKVIQCRALIPNS